jgi:hypothetical protein
VVKVEHGALTSGFQINGKVLVCSVHAGVSGLVSDGDKVDGGTQQMDRKIFAQQRLVFCRVSRTLRNSTLRRVKPDCSPSSQRIVWAWGVEVSTTSNNTAKPCSTVSLYSQLLSDCTEIVDYAPSESTI